MRYLYCLLNRFLFFMKNDSVNCRQVKYFDRWNVRAKNERCNYPESLYSYYWLTSSEQYFSYDEDENKLNAYKIYTVRRNGSVIRINDFWLPVKSMESWVVMQNVLCSDNNVPTLFRNLQNRSPNTLPTKVPNQSFRIISWQTHQERFPIYHPETCWAPLWVWAWEA